MDQKRLLRQRKMNQTLFPEREGPPVSMCKFNNEHCLPPGMVKTLNAYLGSPENWSLKGISVLDGELHKPE